MLKPVPSDAAQAPQSEVEKLQAEKEELARKVEKLTKINQVLMRRVELGWGNHSDAYQSFENAALLADKVRERTRKLHQTIGRLEAANQEVSRAQRESEQARQRLVDSVESLFDAFALFDHQRQMVLANSRFYELWSHTDLTFEMGKTHLADLVRYGREHGIFRHDDDQRSIFRSPSRRFGNCIYQLKDDRWMQTTERLTRDGGLVLTFTDITSLKNSETRQREQALEQQAHILESTINNMSQGVTLIDSNCRLQAWNTRFLEIAGFDPEALYGGMDFNRLIASSELYVGSDILPITRRPSEKWSIQEHEKTLNNGRVILIRRHLVPGGGFVNTYTDITERSQQQAALRESERRIRLITDAVPALISYINRDLKYEFANQQFEKWYGTGRDEIVGKSLLDVLGDTAFELHKPYIELALQGKTVEFEVEDKGPEPLQRFSQKTYAPHYDNHNNIVGFFALEQDVTRQRRTRQALKVAYDNLEERVSQRTREISEINEKLREEINDRLQIEQSLLSAKREAEEANLSKIKFLAATSHDLLQPLNAASLFASSLLEKNLPEDTRHLVGSLSYSLENIESLIGALVDISKLDAGVVEPELGVFNINELLANLANEFSQQLDGGPVRFRFSPSRALVHSDSQLLARILRNFLTNAIRYTAEGGILLGTRRRKHGLEIQVIDTGAGIPEQELERIFEEFHRGKTHSSREDRGLGLGLAIVDKIARILEYPIRVRSSIGQGSCFSVEVPYASETMRAQHQASTPNNMPELYPEQHHRIAVIDNDESICEGMQILLQGWGCDVFTLQTNPQVDQVLAQGFDEQPDLIIADYHLDDGITGLDVVQKINQQQDEPIPVLLITANYTTELRQQVRGLGYHLLNKPIKPLKLKLAMKHLLSSR